MSKYSFDTQQPRAIGDEGPHKAYRSTHGHMESDEAFVVDRAFVHGQTSTSSVPQFERIPIEDARIAKTVDTDDNNNGRHHRSSVSLDMDVILSARLLA